METKNIFQTINSVMTEIGPIGKDSYNSQQGFKYRGVDAVMNALQPLFAKYKLFCVPEVLESKREERESKKGGVLIYSIIKTKYTFFAEDGSSISAIVEGEGMDSADKSTNKALAVAFKYACFQLFCIPTEETSVDPDAESHDIKGKSYRDPVICDKCGKEIQKQLINGALREPEQIKSNCKGLCLECFKEMSKEASATNQEAVSKEEINKIEEVEV